MAKRRDRVAAAIAAGRPVDEETGPVRTCLATREPRPVDELIRFVAGPDGVVVPDLRRRLPGRGAWVTARFEAVRLAAQRNPFPRTLKAPVRAPADLAEQVERLLRRDALGALGMARKAGVLLTGFGQVASAVEADGVIAVIQATDAAPDGVRKIGQSIRRAGRVPVVLGSESLSAEPGSANAASAELEADAPLDTLLDAPLDAPLQAGGEGAISPERMGGADHALLPSPVPDDEEGDALRGDTLQGDELRDDLPRALPVIGAFTSTELGLAFGIERVIHAALTSGSAGDNALRRCQALARFLASERLSGVSPGLSSGRPSRPSSSGHPPSGLRSAQGGGPADRATTDPSLADRPGGDGPHGAAADETS